MGLTEMKCETKIITNGRMGELVRRSGVFIGLLLLCAALSFLTPFFLTVSNILNVIRQTSIIAIVGIGMTFVILTGGIDLSVGSVLALSGVITAFCIVNYGWSLALGMFAGLVIGTVFGLANGVAITGIGLPPFIATLASMSVARGLALVITGGRPIFGLPGSFSFWGEGSIGVFPTPIVVMIVAYIIAFAILRTTRLGLYCYALGGNEEAARLSGVNVKKYKMILYSISGFMAGLGGVILASRLSCAQPLAGQGYELDAIAATVIGGTSLSGGEGSIGGTLVGALIMGVLRNGLNLLNVSAYWQQVAIGLVIAMAVAMDALRKTRRGV